MSSFSIKARHKKTREMHEIWCIDDYFGRHQYGYIPNNPGGVWMNEKEFKAIYEREEQSSAITKEGE